MNRKQFDISMEEFKKNLNIYGADFGRWPEDMRDKAREMVNASDEIHKLVEEERRFEEKLNMRQFEEPAAGFQERIIASAKNSAAFKSGSLSSYLRDIFRSFYLPSPALSLAMMLVIGIMIGYFTSSVSSVNGEDQLLTSQLTLYEGEIYEFED